MKKALIFALLSTALWAASAFGAVAQDLGGVIVYPNPFRPKLGHTVVNFSNLMETSRIKIYKITGELVFEKKFVSATGDAVWGVTNKDGSPVASGIYIYMITSGERSASGKIAILK
jgi:hypothetical protein